MEAFRVSKVVAGEPGAFYCRQLCDHRGLDSREWRSHLNLSVVELTLLKKIDGTIRPEIDHK
jgi:hypothetical protein